MTATKQIGQSKLVIRALRNGAMSLGLMMVSAYALADNVLQDVRYAAAPGGKVDITLQFASPLFISCKARQAPMSFWFHPCCLKPINMN